MQKSTPRFQQSRQADPTGRTRASGLNYQDALHDFLESLLSMQGEMSAATGAAILQPNGDRDIKVVSLYPPATNPSTPPLWIARAASVLQQGDWPSAARCHVLSDANANEASTTRNCFLILPVPHLQNQKAVAVYNVDVAGDAAARRLLQCLAASFGHLDTYFTRRTLQQCERDVEGLTNILQLQHRANDAMNFRTAAMALCNELTTRYHLERASLGLEAGRTIQLMAMSQTEHINRRMNLVQRLEAAMEECFDQDTEILHPVASHAPIATRMTRQLAQEFGSPRICSLPLRRLGEVRGVVTLERHDAREFEVEELRELRILLDLASARLLERYERDRWFGARWAMAARRGLQVVVGPQHTWIKLAAVIMLAAVLLMIFVKGPDRITADFNIEAVERQIIPAPYDGFIQSVNVEPGDPVEARRTILATMDASELQAQLAELDAELATHIKQRDIARQEGQESQVQIAEAQARRTQSRIQSVLLRLDQSQLMSALSGIVILGDLKDRLGAPVSRGDVLFEVAPPEALRAELYVPDHRISELGVGQAGEMATASHPDDAIGFVVESIYPVAQVIDQTNVFRVKVKLDRQPSWVRPGVEGVAKVEVGRKPYGVLWTRDAWNWVRMQLWI